ncbi:MAG TPA: ATP-dependent protease ATPase subunit HslU [Candidatus Faecicola pullistercoris]|nr:ATP-dependent protease ATPase subunit HslU [Candidatus Faecicola pullistercoris]
MMELTPKQIVAELDRFIIGQDGAKKAVAIALRNRYRRSCLEPEMREEITPKNIIMKGATGVGKTEIARRLAKIVKAPFVKVEATKFTEVGYVGRDVESMIRELVEASIRMVREEKIKEVQPKVTDLAERKIIDMVLPIRKKASPDTADALLREELLQELRAGKLDGIDIEIETTEQPKPIQLGAGETQEIDLGSIFGGFMGGRKKKKRKLTVKQAMNIITSEEASRLIDEDAVTAEALKRAENDGIVFIDEIDKIAGAGRQNGPDVSREGVQRDILPIVEGCTVKTKYGQIRTDYMLFIAAGAFHISKIQDLIPELLGRFPVKVELDNLTEKDFIRILTEVDNALLRQYAELLKVDHIVLKFTDEAVSEIAKIAAIENETSENLGARRLHTVMEQLIEDISFNAGGDMPDTDVVIDKAYVQSHMAKSLSALNFKKYIL